MRNVLIISYYFPPSGGPGVQRVLKFTRYLPSLGWRPLVLTVPENAAFPVRDPSLAREIPPEALVFRSGIREFYGIYRAAAGEGKSAAPVNLATAAREGGGFRERILRAARGALFIPDGRVGWLPDGTRKAAEICRREKVDVIFASGPPFSAHWIARRTSERTGIPLVLDFRDPWTRAPFYPRRPAWARRLDEKLERSCLRRAAAVVTVNRSIREDFLARYRELDPERLHMIPNGYDPADFEGIAPKTAPSEHHWTLTHTGTLPLHLPSGLVPALAGLAREDAGAFSEAGLRLLLAGRIDPDTTASLMAPPLDRVTSVLGYLPHADSLRLLIRSDLLLLLIEDGPQGHGMVTGKLFEYLGSRRPILALAPEGEAAEILRATAAGRVVRGDDVAGIMQALREARAAYREGRRAFGRPDTEIIARYSRPRLAAELAAVLERTRLSAVSPLS